MRTRPWLVVLVATVLVVFSLAGCGVLDDGVGDTGDGQIIAEVVPHDPNATTVPYSDERIQNNDYLQRAVTAAVQNASEGGDGRVVVIVPKCDVDEMKETHRALPGSNHLNHSDLRYPHYVTYRNYTVGVRSAIYT